MDWTAGWRSGSGAIGAMPTWCVRSWLGGVGSGGRDVGTGGGDGDGPAPGVGLGHEADRPRTRVRPQDGEAVSAARRVAGLSPTPTGDGAGWTGRLAGGAVPAPSGQCRRGAPGTGRGAWHHGIAAHGGAEVGRAAWLQGLGWGTKRIARELGCDRKTVKRYLRRGGWQAYRQPQRATALDGLDGWLAERFRRHRGNADVVRQELAGEHGITVSLRTVERAVTGLRQEMRAEAKATVRFETPPGKQLQIDFGTTAVAVGDEMVRVHLFVATLGYSRRTFVTAFRHERQAAWMAGLEAAFQHFGGVPKQVLIDNAKTLVTHHDRETREVTFNGRFHAFARYWGFTPQACAPYRAQTKGKDENGVGYVKKNAIAGRRFASWEALEAHLVGWMRDIADVRIHGTTGERPIDRFMRLEAASLPPFQG